MDFLNEGRKNEHEGKTKNQQIRSHEFLKMCVPFLELSSVVATERSGREKSVEICLQHKTNKKKIHLTANR